ncbi:MAG TPA: EAL domain-containing protein [Stenomitos sp.]
MTTHLHENSPGKILIIDDVPDNLRVLSAALSAYGYQIRCAKSGAMGLLGVKTSPPDLVLLDIKMPDMDGYSVCKALKADPQAQHIPVIFLSAMDDVFDKVKAFEAGGVDYITKPFQVEEVLVRVQHQLALQFARRDVERLNQELEQRVQTRTAELKSMNQRLEAEISERLYAERQLQASEQRLESILNSLEEVVWSIAIPTHTTSLFAIDKLEILYLNPAAEKVYGRKCADFCSNPSLRLSIIHPEDVAQVQHQLSKLFELKQLKLEYRILQPNGEVRWLSDHSRLMHDEQGHTIRLDSIVADITEQKRAQTQLMHDALHDALTGLPNRTLFMDRIEQALQRSKRHDSYVFAVLFIDLDRFKVVNDSLGHAIGDQLLIEIAQLLKGSVRKTDTVARLGGDEFTVLLDSLRDSSDAIMLAERLLEQLAEPLLLGGHTVFTGASIGIVLGTSHYCQGADLLRDADIAMYWAKGLGKAQYAVFDQRMHEQTLQQLHLENDLRRALEREEFSLRYQPIYDLQTEKLHGFEALVRWNHPTRGLVSPAEFIPMAEETGLIVPMGEWVLQAACRQYCAWQRQYGSSLQFQLSVNLASKQIQAPNLLEILDCTLAETGIPGSALNLEITESMLMDQGEATRTLLSAIRSRQILLSIDDFGTGYSSLGYLRRFPVNTLKIDRSFVSQMTVDSENFEIVRTIITLAHTLGLTVTAEGVETHEQFRQLQALGCAFAQGYFFAPPLDMDAATELLAKQVPMVSVVNQV